MTWPRMIWPGALLALLYFVLGKAALQMAVAPGYATAVWPAAGLALGCVLVWGPRVAPAVAVGSFFVNLGTSFDASSALALARSVGLAAGIGAGAALQALVGARLVRAYVPRGEELRGERQILALLGLGGPVACGVSASVGVGALLLLGQIRGPQLLFSASTWWVGDSIGVLVFAPLTLLALGGADRGRQLTVALPTLSTFGIVTAGFLWVSSWERDRLSVAFERQAAPLGRAFGAALDEHAQMVDSAATLLEVFPDLDGDSFRAFVQPLLLEHPGLRALSWNPLVQDQSGEHVPILFIEPLASNLPVIGFDIAADPHRRAALQRARESGKLAVSASVVLLQSGAPGNLLVEPVTSADGAVRGFAVGVFEIEQALSVALDGHDLAGLALELRDGTTGASLYRTQEPYEGAELRWESTFSRGGQSWQLVVLPVSAEQSRSWVAWSVLAVGLSVVALLELVMLVVTGRAERAQIAEARLRAVLDRAPLILFSLDRDGFTGLSEGSALKLLGRKPGQVDPTSVFERYASEPAMLVTIRRALAGERFTSIDKLRGISLETRWEPVLDAAGRPDGTVGVSLDVTDLERSRAELRSLNAELEHRVEARTEELAESERRFRTLFEDSPLSLWEVALHAPELVRLRQVNAAALQMFEARDLEELQEGLPRVFGEGASPFRAALAAFVAGQTTFEAEAEVSTLRGRALEVSLRCSAVQGHEHAWTRVGVAIVDLTAHRKAQRALVGALQEKEILLKEIHHRVKNNLQVVASLLRLQAHQVDQPEVHRLFEQAQARIRSIALVHERLYRAEDLARVDFGAYLSDLVERLLHAHDAGSRGVTARLEVDDTRLPVSAAVPCGLLVSELVTNALRHAFPAGRPGVLTVRLRTSSAGHAELTVADDGVGLPPGFAPRSAETLGFELVYTFAEQLEAQLELESSGRGTSVRLHFPTEHR